MVVLPVQDPGVWWPRNVGRDSRHLQVIVEDSLGHLLSQKCLQERVNRLYLILVGLEDANSTDGLIHDLGDFRVQEDSLVGFC